MNYFKVNFSFAFLILILIYLNKIDGFQTGGASCKTASDCNANVDPVNICYRAVSNQTKGVCKCGERYILDNCTYHQKSQLAAFLISFFAGTTGADRFYLGYIGIGVLKLLFPILVLPITCVFVCIASCTKIEVLQKGGIVAVVVLAICETLGIVIWWIVDWALIANGTMLDYNGYPLFADL